MNLEKFKPWNWFRHENTGGHTVPVSHREREQRNAVQDPLAAVHNDIDRLFENALSRMGLGGFPASGEFPLSLQHPGAFSPEINIASEENQYLITVDAPGMDDNDLSIELHDRDLIIRGEKQDEQESRDRHYYHMERRYGSFQRVLTLPEDADAQAIKANMKRGVLTINIPRTKPASDQNARRIEIEQS